MATSQEDDGAAHLPFPLADVSFLAQPFPFLAQLGSDTFGLLREGVKPPLESLSLHLGRGGKPAREGGSKATLAGLFWRPLSGLPI